MVKKHIDVDALVEDWVIVSEGEDPIPFKAWDTFRREKLKCNFTPKAFTVPTMFPPVTVAEANKYIDALTQIRKSIGWASERAKLPRDVTAWRA